ncbi:MAG TPA: methyltransferase domain-containing protein [Nannocystaceae bacterium]|nr:methyltransferase domain-containing protein [Nannocystaceae bacterium]
MNDTRADGAAPWWHDLYDDLLADVLLVRGDADEVEATLDFLARSLELRPGARVFDQCCGIGSLALPLAARGYEVVGVDLIPGYIERARACADGQGLSATFVAADAFTFVPDAPCDGAFNWWTGFGYADADADNLEMLVRVREALRPGARFVLDTMNAPGLLRDFQPHVVRRRQTPRGEVILVRESALDLRAGAITKTWTYFLPDGRRVSHPSRVRLYMPHELVRLFSAAGFVEVELLGDVDGRPLALSSPRCIVRARAPEESR